MNPSDETLKTMNDEEASDKHLRGTFGAKWTRTKSEDLTKNLKEQGAKYKVRLLWLHSLLFLAANCEICSVFLVLIDDRRCIEDWGPPGLGHR